MVPDRYSHIVLIIVLQAHTRCQWREGKERVGMRSERCWLLGGNLLTLLSTALGVSPYNLIGCEQVFQGHEMGRD